VLRRQTVAGGFQFGIGACGRLNCASYCLAFAGVLLGRKLGLGVLGYDRYRNDRRIRLQLQTCLTNYRYLGL
jgi:hypothetical protein